MARVPSIIIILLCLLGAATTWTHAQTQVTNAPLNLSVIPGTNAILIAETTNGIQVVIGNPDAFTNVVIFGLVPTNQISTNMIGTNVINTNIIGSDFRMNFRLKSPAPEDPTNEVRYISNLITPATTNGFLLTLRITVRAEDLSLTNAPLDDTNLVFVTTNVFMTYRVLPRPQNNLFVNAFKFDPAGGISVGSNNLANLEPREPVHAQLPNNAASVWWTWSAGTTTNVLVDTAGSSFNPILAVYTGTSVTQLTAVAVSTNDTINRLKANVSFNAVRGTTYRIAVAGADTNAVGNIRLRVTPGATPDTRPPTVLITSPNRETLVGTEFMTLGGTARDGALDSGISNVVLIVNSGQRTNATGTASWIGSVQLPPGTNLVRAIAVDFAGNESIADAVVVRYITPTNDFFASAQPLTGVGGLLSWTNNAATREAGEPLHAGNDGGRSVWFSFRAPTVGVLNLSTETSTFDTLLALYSGDSLTNLQEISFNDDAFPGSKYSALSQNVVSNQLYYIALDGYGAAAGNYALQYSFVAPTPGQFYSVTLAALPGGQISPNSSVYPAGSRLTVTATPDLNYEFAGWDGNNTGQNPLTLAVSGNLALTARFRPSITNVTEDFETGALNRLAWINAAAAPWTVQTNIVFSGKFSARSGPVADGQRSSLVLVTNMVAGTAAFDLKVSSEDGWDFLEFHLNGDRLRRWSGDLDWTNFTFKVAAGTNRLEWVYAKDPNFSQGEDAALIDNLYLPVAPVRVSDLAARVAATRLANRAMQVTVIGYPARIYDIEASSDLVVWLPLATRTSDSGVIQFIDNQAPSRSARFYRAVTR